MRAGMDCLTAAGLDLAEADANRLNLVSVYSFCTRWLVAIGVVTAWMTSVGEIFLAG